MSSSAQQTQTMAAMCKFSFIDGVLTELIYSYLYTGCAAGSLTTLEVAVEGNKCGIVCELAKAKPNKN